MTELGATGFTCQQQAGVHLIESEFIFEVVDPRTLQPVADGERGELVATNLGRAGMPLICYRTGHLMQLDERACACGRTFARLAGGILGRADDMPQTSLAEQVANRLHQRLLLRVPCELVPPGSLPRFELKAQRLVHLSG